MRLINVRVDEVTNLNGRHRQCSVGVERFCQCNEVFGEMESLEKWGAQSDHKSHASVTHLPINLRHLPSTTPTKRRCFSPHSSSVLASGPCATLVLTGLHSRKLNAYATEKGIERVIIPEACVSGPSFLLSSPSTLWYGCCSVLLTGQTALHLVLQSPLCKAKLVTF